MWKVLKLVRVPSFQDKGKISGKKDQLDSLNGDLIIELLDSQKRHGGENMEIFDLSDLLSGQYVLSIIIRNNIFSSKLIKI